MSDSIANKTEVYLSHPPPEAVAWQRPATRFAFGLSKWFLGSYHSIELLTPPTLPASGPALLVCNHISGMDPVVIQVRCTRLISWMMAAEYFNRPQLNWIYRSIQCIPVQRSGKDLAATRAALRMLEAGYVVGLFPEGKIAPRGDVLPFQAGVSMLALKAGVPVIPAYIDGSMYDMEMVEAFVNPARGLLAFGPPIALDYSDTSREAMERVAGQIRDAVLRVRDEHVLPAKRRGW